MTLTAEPEISVRTETAPAKPVAETSKPPASVRLVSIDAYRGLVMLLMISAGLEITGVVRNFDRTPQLQSLHTHVWDVLAFNADHVAWTGGGLWDMIQPSFMFLVGTAMAFSLASRRAKGQSFARMLGHAIFRSVALILLGVFLISNWSKHRTDWVFVNVLTQIGLGYTFLFLLAWLKPRWQLLAVGVILVGYWAAFAMAHAPAASTDNASLGLPADWVRQQGFAAHWEKNANPAARFDHWFLNLFPRDDGKPYDYNKGGYTTLSFIPSLATMLLGLLAGELLRSRQSAGRKVLALFAAGIVGLGVGWALGWLGVCPVVKRIWTPSWVLYSAGWSLLALGFFYLVIDVAKLKKWAFPLVVVGMNSIVIYSVAQLMKPWVRDTMHRHFGQQVYDLLGSAIYGIKSLFYGPAEPGMGQVWGKAFVPMAEAGFFLLFCWFICWWMYRRKLFVKI